MSISIQRIQTDRGLEFSTCNVQEKLRSWSIKFRPIRPPFSRINGKVERVQTTQEEFWLALDLKDPELETRVAEWQHFSNWERPHDSRDGRAPIDRLCNMIRQAPTGVEIADAHDPETSSSRPQISGQSLGRAESEIMLEDPTLDP